jgi:GntR family transcriptional regulator, rspAB operon transcriptional repressor
MTQMKYQMSKTSDIERRHAGSMSTLNRSSRSETSGPRQRSAPNGKPLAERAYELLKERIISARYLPGQFLQEGKMCADLKLGRTPVHQALHRLHLEGLVEIIPRKGILIKADSLSEILVALEARLLVEPYCAAQCAEKASAGDIRTIENLHDEYRRLKNDSDKHKLMELDRRMHTQIAVASGNYLLSDFLRPIHERMTRIWFLPHWQSQDYGMTSDEHDILIRAIKNRSGVAARDAMRKHLESLKMRILSGNAQFVERGSASRRA